MPKQGKGLLPVITLACCHSNPLLQRVPFTVSLLLSLTPQSSLLSYIDSITFTSSFLETFSIHLVPLVYLLKLVSTDIKNSLFSPISELHLVFSARYLMKKWPILKIKLCQM